MIERTAYVHEKTIISRSHRSHTHIENLSTASYKRVPFSDAHCSRTDPISAAVACFRTTWTAGRTDGSSLALRRSTDSNNSLYIVQGRVVS